MTKPDHDVVVIGGGLGGLAAAAVLAKGGRNVCVVESHDEVGGAASTYRIGDLTIEAALHETANPFNPVDPKHFFLKRLGLLDAIEWVPVGGFYSVRGGPVGKEPFAVGHGFSDVWRAFAERFGDPGTDRVLERMEDICSVLAGLMKAGNEHSVAQLMRSLFKAGPLVSDWRLSLTDVFDQELEGNEAAKCALAANLPYYSDDPAKLWWIFFAVAQGTYIGTGSYYLKGGSSALTGTLRQFIEENGGTVLTGCEVHRAQPPDGEAAAEVEYRRTGNDRITRLKTTAIVANCAPRVLSGMLPEPLRARFYSPYRKLEPSTSLFSVYFGVNADTGGVLPREYSNMVLPQWMRSLSDYAMAGDLLGAMPTGRLPPFALVNYRAADSGLGDGQLGLITVTGIDRVENWVGLTQHEEAARREAWSDAIQEEIERYWPGFSSLVEQRHFVSAASMQRYLRTPGGAVYGFATPPPKKPIWFGREKSPKTALPGVFLASSYAGAGGYSGSLGTGAMAGDLVEAWLKKSRGRS
ncbi:phytoene desaturase family protein [Oricola sp.]|uniref:phytoene desaturase family protein n=1 Tax=Oricola sp. TaxID=1979950 RepID=UPI003BA998E8